MMDAHTLKRIQRCYDDYSERDQAAYRAFWTDAHKNMGLLLDEIRRLQHSYRSGAEAMREAAAKACETSPLWREWELDKAPEDFAAKIVRSVEPPK